MREKVGVFLAFPVVVVALWAAAALLARVLGATPGWLAFLAPGILFGAFAPRRAWVLAVPVVWVAISLLAIGLFANTPDCAVSGGDCDTLPLWLVPPLLGVPLSVTVGAGQFLRRRIDARQARSVTGGLRD